MNSESKCTVGVFIIFVLLATLAVSAQESGVRRLTFREAIFARAGEGDRLVYVEDRQFRRGEKVNLVLLKVGTFKTGPDGKSRIELDLKVTDPDGKVILNQTGLLGNEGHMSLEGGIAPSLSGIFTSHVGMKSGEYRMTVTVHDVLDGARCEVTESFSLSGDLSYQSAVFAKRGQDGKLTPVEEAAFFRGEVVNLVLFNVGPFVKGADGKHWFDINMEVRDPNGKVVLDKKGMLGENGHILLENNFAESPYSMFYSHIEMDPGRYRMVLTIYDRVSQRELALSKFFDLK